VRARAPILIAMFRSAPLLPLAAVTCLVASSGCGALVLSVDECARDRVAGAANCDGEQPPDSAGTQRPGYFDDIPGGQKGAAGEQAAEGTVTSSSGPSASDAGIADPDPDPGEPSILPLPGESLVSDDPRFPSCDDESCYCDFDSDCGVSNAWCGLDGTCGYYKMLTVTDDEDDAVEHQGNVERNGRVMDLRPEAVAAFLFHDALVPDDADVYLVELNLHGIGWPNAEVMFDLAATPQSLSAATPSERAWTADDSVSWGGGVLGAWGWMWTDDLSAPYEVWRSSATPGASAVVGVHMDADGDAQVLSGREAGQICDDWDCAPTLVIEYTVSYRP
jgi:hypothetical protein